MPTLALPATDWIAETCRRFSTASGWRLSYTPVADASADVLEARMRSDAECCWFRAVEDGQQRVGFLHLQLPENAGHDRAFTTVCDMAEMTADLIDHALSTAKALESRTNEVSTLVEIGLSVPNEKDLVGALNQLLRAAVQLTGFRSACFFLLEPSAQRLNLRIVSHLELDQVPFRTRQLAQQPPDLGALSRGRILLQSDPTSSAGNWLPDGMATGICVAVQSEAGPLGTLWVYDRRRREPTDREVHVLESIAAQVATVLERVVLLRESAVQHRLQRDLRVASECQPQDIASRLPNNCGFQAAAICTSRHEIGGDLCELIPVGRRQTVVAVGDASGDSIPAALVMSAVRGALRSLSIDPAANLSRTDQIVERINQALHSITPPHQFMSLFYGVIDAEAKSFTYTNAGHPTPLFIHAGQLLTLKSHGMLLGVTDDAIYERSVLPLAAGDVLVAFSDGVSEAMNLGRKMFRSDGIATVVKRRATESPAEILNAIWEELESHLAGSGDADDRTLLVMRIDE